MLIFHWQGIAAIPYYQQRRISMFVLRGQKQRLPYWIIVCILLFVSGCDNDKIQPIQSLIMGTDNVEDVTPEEITDNVEDVTPEEMFRQEILIPPGTPQIVTIEKVDLQRFTEEDAIDRLHFDQNTPLYITREVSFSGDPVFEILEEDTYGDPEDNLISQIMPFLPFTFSKSEHLIKEPHKFGYEGVDGRFQGYALPLKDPNGNLIFRPGDEIEVVQDRIWKRNGTLFFASTFRVTRNLTRPEIDYSIYDWDADFYRPQ